MDERELQMVLSNTSESTTRLGKATVQEYKYLRLYREKSVLTFLQDLFLYKGSPQLATIQRPNL